MKKCYICQLEKDFLEFNKDSSRKSGLRYGCKACHKEKRNNKKAYLYDFIIQHFENNPCISCGESNPILLDFDHLKDKKIGISMAVKNQWSLEKLQDEIDKCQVLCANCHRMKTAKDQNWYMYNKLYKSK